MISSTRKNISIIKQCQLLRVHRSRYYYQPKPASPDNLKLMRLIDEQHLETPFYGSRKMVYFLRRQGYKTSRGRVRRLMRIMNIRVIYQKPRTSIANKAHKIYPYLLRDIKVTKPNQAWAAKQATACLHLKNITYIPMKL
jgi:putative transposase